MNFQKKAEEVWGKVEKENEVNKAMLPTCSFLAREICKSIVAAALEQAYKEGVEAMRDAAVKKATEIMGVGSPYIGFTRDSMYSIAVRLLSKSEEV